MASPRLLSPDPELCARMRLGHNPHVYDGLEVTLHAIVLSVVEHPEDFAIRLEIPAWEAPFNQVLSQSLWNLQEGAHYNLRETSFLSLA